MSRRRKRKLPIAAAPMAPQGPQGQALIDAVEQKVESQLMPDAKESYLKIVVAGMKAGLQGGPNSILAGLKTSQDPIADCAKGAIGLVLVLKHQAKGVMPLKAMVPAAMTLMLKALTFADRMGIVKVGANEVVRATHIFADAMLKKLGVTPQMMQHAMVKTHALTQDPVAMEQMKRTAGVTRHPEAPPPGAPGPGAPAPEAPAPQQPSLLNGGQ